MAPRETALGVSFVWASYKTVPMFARLTGDPKTVAMNGAILHPRGSGADTDQSARARHAGKTGGGEEQHPPPRFAPGARPGRQLAARRRRGARLNAKKAP